MDNNWWDNIDKNSTEYKELKIIANLVYSATKQINEKVK